MTFDRIACRVNTAASSGGVVRLGIYEATSDGLVGNLILDAGTVATNSTGVKEITISQTLAAGKYWLAVVGQVAGCTLRADNAIQHSFTQSSFSNDDRDCLEQSGVTGALPNPFTGTSSRNTAPRIMLRRS
jgi:hypothetical protein